MEEFIKELASNPYFIVITGIVTILGFFTCKKIYNKDKSKKIGKNNQTIGNNSNNNQQTGIQ